MRMLAVAAATVVALTAPAAAMNITNVWFTDDQCTQGAEAVTVTVDYCYYTNAGNYGMEWQCSGADTNLVVYAPGDTSCAKGAIGNKLIPPNQCVGPLNFNMYVMTKGC